MTDVARLLEQEIPSLRRYARALTREAAAADDLVQSCLLRALARQHQFQPGSKLRAWLFTMLHNLRVSELRCTARENRMLAEVSYMAARWHAGDPGARDELLDLDRAIGRLSEPHRALRLLVGLEEMTYREAAMVLRVPVGTVRSRVARARDALRRLMGSEEDGAVLGSLPAALPRRRAGERIAEIRC